MTSIYVAGASKDLARAKRVIQWCRDAGFEITMDWVAAVERERAAGHATDADMPSELRQQYARMDLSGVADADVVWLLVPDQSIGSLGMWVEFGFALALNAHTREPDVPGVPRIVVSHGADAKNSIFLELADKTFEDVSAQAADAEALEYLVLEYVRRT